ncbi:MAG: multiple antibiotic resistance protein [Sulfurimonas sp.]|jgi:multiple antibiotic resistance protein
MQSFLELFLQQTITFFAIIDPIGVSAVMLSLLHINITKQEINKIAYKSTITIVVAFFVVMISGDFLLKMFGINVNSLKVIGGIVLILMSLNMIQGSTKEAKAISNDEVDEIKEYDDLSVIPLGIPIIFGPGLFTTIIILEHQHETFVGMLSMSLAFLANAFLIYVAFKNSIHIKKFLGLTGQNIITKIMGLVVGAIAVQFIVNGIIELSKLYLK